MNTIQELGIVDGKTMQNQEELINYIYLQMAALGLQDIHAGSHEHSVLDVAEGLITSYREKLRMLSDYLCPADQRIQDFIERYFADVENKPVLKLPALTFTLDRWGVARVLSLPEDKKTYSSEYVTSYKVKQGILHNPKNDRRTTQGVFHVAEGGLPIPDDKKAVSRAVTANLLYHAFKSEDALMEIPFTESHEQKARIFVSLLLRPVVCPEVPHVSSEKTMEIRFFAPGSLVSNLDFVESIFGNAGNPYMLSNDAALDIEHWTGHTGCVILAPHLTKFTKKYLGLPHISEATPRQIRDGMCWEKEDERYNEGQAFKLAIRDERGIIVTIIADNYFGYSKKEVKSHISYAANLYGSCEEEHAGGAVVFPAYNQGDTHLWKDKSNDGKKNADKLPKKYTFAKIKDTFGDIMNLYPEGYGIDKKYANIYYVPENSFFDIVTQTVSWKQGDATQKLKLLPKNIYITPNGSKFRMEKNPGAPNYRLVEAISEGVFCHKPCTVSGGGKSEISKSIQDAIFTGPFNIVDLEKDFDQVDEIFNYDYTDRVKKVKDSKTSRTFLSMERSIGSVIKLLSPSPDYTDEYNQWISSIPPYIKGIAFLVKRYYKTEWGKNWRQYFSVDILNGQPGHELKFGNRKLFARYLRVGFEKNGAWRTFKLRQDFVHADKVQMEDDISVSAIVPANDLKYLNKIKTNKSLKIVANCEYRFFQRPDDAIHRGYDKKAELDLATPGTFISNFEPLPAEYAQELIEDVMNFDMYTDPMRKLIEEVDQKKNCKYFVSSAHPRIVDGKPSKNVRYLQTRNDLLEPIYNYIAEIGTRFAHHIPLTEKLVYPVDAVLPGRRNNPSEPGIKPLAVYNPLHYQELPELFMDFICSLTGKSPSTTGAGSEGALTKGPFNSLCAITDLNNALVSYMLTGYDGFTTPAGYIGAKYRVDHDISLLIPELWSRLSMEERSAADMIQNGYLEKVEDFTYKGQVIPANILGYRITAKFVSQYLGRIFDNPTVVFVDDMLKPELQNMEEYVEGINNIVDSQKKVALAYFEDGSIEAACPPLEVLLHIMAYGNYKGKTLKDAKIRALFKPESLMKSDWYQARILAKQQSDASLWNTHAATLERYQKRAAHLTKEQRDHINKLLETSQTYLKHINSFEYQNELKGTLGKDILYKG